MTVPGTTELEVVDVSVDCVVAAPVVPGKTSVVVDTAASVLVEGPSVYVTPAAWKPAGVNESSPDESVL